MDDKAKDNIHVFRGTYDMPLDSPEQIERDLSDIHMQEMDESASQDEKKCDPDEFVEAHWRAYLNETGRLVEDTYLTKGKNKPPEVRIGAF